MPHRDTSEWDDDLIAYAKACWGAVPCEEHPHCLRDATDDELCERMIDRNRGLFRVVYKNGDRILARAGGDGVLVGIDGLPVMASEIRQVSEVL